MKKAQGISINTIIIAAIALIVLIILIAVFTGRMGWWGRDLSTAQQGPVCSGDIGTPVSGACGPNQEQVLSNFRTCTDKITTECLQPGYVCCKNKQK